MCICIYSLGLSEIREILNKSTDINNKIAPIITKLIPIIVYGIEKYLVSLNNVESRLEIALAGFKKKEVYVYTQDGKLFVEGQKEDKETETNYVHKGMAQRSFTRAWTLSEDTEVRSVTFEDGLLSIVLGKIVPEAHKRKDYL